MTSQKSPQFNFQRSDASTDSGQPTANGSLTTAIAAQVADQTNDAPEQLPPLYEVINPDALATLFEPTVAGEQRSNGHVTFTYCGYHVTVTSQGDIAVETLS